MTTSVRSMFLTEVPAQLPGRGSNELSQWSGEVSMFRKRDAMTKPSYEERRIAKHSGSPQIADSASNWVSTRTPSEIRKFVLLVIVAVVWISNAFILEADRLYRTTMNEVAAPDIPTTVGFVLMGEDCPAKGD